MIPCIFLKNYYSKISGRYVNYCMSKSAFINRLQCETCSGYDPTEEEDPDPPKSFYEEKGKVIKTLSSDDKNIFKQAKVIKTKEDKKETVLSKSDLERQLEQFRSPRGKGGGNHGKRKKERYIKNESKYR